VVDDEPQVAETLRDILVHEGLQVEVAENGRQALDLLMNGNRFDLIITDMKMPEMDGLELLRHVRQLKENLPVIVLTGAANFKNGLEAIREGVFNYISKPFSVRLLMNIVHEALKDKD
jgi:DNA-binding NtrC family response regulator